MFNMFQNQPLWEVSQSLTAVAMGREPADLVIKNGRLINVCTREIQDDIDVAVKNGRIALVGNADHCIGDATEVIEANGRYIAPGFLDGHVHVESSMMSLTGYAKAVVPHGTTGIYMDPHEIGNVLGMDGVKYMIENGAHTPLKNLVTMPSCVPAVPGFEDTGGEIGPDDVAEAMQWEGIVGLGEMMNFPGILSGSDHTHRIVGETLKAKKIVTGHWAIPETGKELSAYIASGIRACHESTTKEEALAKMRLGMYAQLREGSAWRDLHEVAKAVTEENIDTRFTMLVSDDSHPHTLVEKGHLDHIVRRAVEEGIDILTAIQMVTINTAQAFQMDHEIGSVTPGKCADIVLIENLMEFHVNEVIIDGNLVAKNGRMCIEPDPYEFPKDATHTMHIKETITAESFQVPTQKKNSVKVRAITIIPEKVGTTEQHIVLPVLDGAIQADPEQDVLKAVVFERHHNTGTKGFGFVKGFHIKNGAMASTVAHDAHNLLVLGSNDEDMAIAANALVECGGGMAVAQNGKIVGLLPLPIAGLMSDEPVEEIVSQVELVSKAWETIGCDIESPFMTMALIPLAVIPDIRLTNRGLVDVTTFEFVPLEVE